MLIKFPFKQVVFQYSEAFTHVWHISITTLYINLSRCQTRINMALTKKKIIVPIKVKKIKHRML